MSRIKNMLVLTGGNIDLRWADKWIKNEETKRPFDYVMAADSGLMAVDALGLNVNYLLGDYDSVSAEVLARYRNEVETVTFPREKDYTDTEIAVRTAIELMKNDGDDECEVRPRVTFLGATGTRLDHTMANVGLMLQFIGTDIECIIVDRHNKIRMISDKQKLSIKKNEQFGRFVSLLPLSDCVYGITMSGVKYPLDNQNIKKGVSLCVSNEIIDDELNLLIEKGNLLIFETRD